MLLWTYLIICPSVYFENLQIHISKLFILNWVNLERISFLKELLPQGKDENENRITTLSNQLRNFGYLNFC